MSNDPLDKETSVSVEVNEAGVKAKSNSRALAAIDRLGGNAFDLLNVRAERRLSRERAIICAEKKVIEAVTEAGLERLKNDPEFARRMTDAHLIKIMHHQDNKDAVLIEAIEDMRNDPMSDAAAGPSELSPEFMDRFERYAEDASTEELQKKWGRVLSAEIRKPGTFSRKALRVVEELDAETAQLFEKLCKSRLDNVLPQSLVGKLSFGEVAALVSADLLIDPGEKGQIRQSVEGTKGHEQVWVVGFGEYGVSFPKSVTLGRPGAVEGPRRVLTSSKNNGPAIPVYVLTHTGRAIAEILPNHRRDAFRAMIAKLKEWWPDEDIRPLKYVPATGQFEDVEII